MALTSTPQHPTLRSDPASIFTSYIFLWCLGAHHSGRTTQTTQNVTPLFWPLSAHCPHCPHCQSQSYLCWSRCVSPMKSFLKPLPPRQHFFLSPNRRQSINLSENMCFAPQHIPVCAPGLHLFLLIEKGVERQIRADFSIT